MVLGNDKTQPWSEQRLAGFCYLHGGTGFDLTAAAGHVIRTSDVTALLSSGVTDATNRGCKMGVSCSCGPPPTVDLLPTIRAQGKARARGEAEKIKLALPALQKQA